MDDDTNPQWSSIARWSPALFLAGGGLLVGHAAMLGVQAFSNVTTPPDVLGPAGHLVALVGLLGLYPALENWTPTVARVAGAVATVAVGSWAVLALARVLAVAGLVASPSGVLPGVLFLLAFASTILAYTTFGVATVRFDDSSQFVGLFLLAPAALLVVVLVDSAVTGATAVDGLVVGAGLALSTLALGYTLRTGGRPAEYAAQADDVTAG